MLKMTEFHPFESVYLVTPVYRSDHRVVSLSTGRGGATYTTRTGGGIRVLTLLWKKKYSRGFVYTRDRPT